MGGSDVRRIGRNALASRARRWTRRVALAHALGLALLGALALAACGHAAPPAVLLQTNVEPLPRGAATIVPVAMGPRRDLRSPAGTTFPFQRPVFDAQHDRFVLPGFYAVERNGRTTHGLEVLEAGGSPGVAHRPVIRDRSDHRIVAIWRGPESTVVLHGSMVPRKNNPHGCRNPSNIQVSVFAKEGGARRASYVLTLADGWDARAALDRFLVDGNLVAPVDARQSDELAGRYDRGRRLSAILRRRSATIRIDALGHVSVLPRERREWPAAIRAPSSKAASVVWQVHELGPRPRLAAVSPGGSERVHTLPRGADVTSLAVHDDGACALVRRGYAYELTCLDGDARVRWARRLPKEATRELVVDADGRLYLTMVDGVVALDPSGAVAWRWTGGRRTGAR